MVRFDAPALWDSAVDPESGVTVALAGRVAFDASEWARADKLAYRGGAACKLLLDAWNRSESDFGDQINGAAVVTVFSPQTSELHLFTDRMGVFPVYQSVVGPTMLCSHPDVLADVMASQGNAPAFDLTTMAECLATGNSVHPYTYHSTIHQLDAATHYVFSTTESNHEVQKQCFWKPSRAADSNASAEDLTLELANALRTAGARRTASILGTNGLLLSGGADSRALLFSAPQPELVESLTFCDTANSESLVAQQIAAVAGSRHHLLHRSPEHYAEGALETVRITGGMFSLKDAHFQGFMPSLRKLNLGNLMTGCYTDYLLKGLAYNKTPRKLFGRPLPLDRLTPFSMEYYQPYSSINVTWRSRVDHRLQGCFPTHDQEQYDIDPDTIADRRVRPLSREADAMGRLFLLRTTPWDPVMVENEILSLYQRIPANLKLNARVFRAAVTQLVPSEARKIPNNNDFSTLDTSEPVRLMRYVLRKFGDRIPSVGQSKFSTKSLGTAGSWPNFVYFVKHSQVLPILWRDPSAAQRELLSDLLGEDPWRRTLAEWADFDVDLILRLITLKLWLGLRGV